MRNETAFVVIVTRAVRNIPVDGRLERRRNTRRMVYVILKQILCDTRTAERITVIQTQGPFQHFVLFHLRRKPAVKRTAPVETLRKFVTPVRKFRESDLVRIRIVLVVETVTRIDGEHVILQNLESERRRNIGEIQRIRRKVVRKAMSRREQSAGPVLVFDHLRLLRRIATSRIDMASHLEVLDIKVVAQAEPNRLLFLLVRRLPQERMRSERLYRINFGRIRVRNARRKHMTNTREPSNFRHPDTVKFRIGSQAVAMIVSDIAKRSFARIKAHVAFSFVQRVIRVPPRCTRPIPGERRPRRDVDNVKNSARIIQRVSSRISYVMRGRIFVQRFIPVAAHVVVKAIRKTVVELFEERLERAVFCSDLALLVQS